MLFFTLAAGSQKLPVGGRGLAAAEVTNTGRRGRWLES
jgi:hypothetical protein